MTKEDLKEEIIDKVEQLKDIDNLENILDYVTELFDDETEEILERFKARKNQWLYQIGLNGQK